LSSVNKNIAFNYAGQMYSTLIGVVVLPLFLNYVGAEAYGLIGFYTLVQSWMTLLDLGMTPTLGREVARLRVRPKETQTLVTVVNSLESAFLSVAIVLAITIFVGKEWVATSWLNIEEIHSTTVATVVGIIGLTVAVRWVSSLNKSGINAYEHQGWLNVFDIVVNTFRFPGSLLLVIVFDGSVLAYFYFQLFVVIIEVFLLRSKLRELMPRISAPRFSISELRRIAPFAVSIGYTTAIWVLITQLDKLVLSKTLTLSEYGYFTLVATVSSGLMMLSGPVSKAILPRMTALFTQGSIKEMILIYRRSTKLIVVLVMPIAVTVACLPYNVLYAWTGNESAAEWGKDILTLYVLGSAMLAIIAFQYYLQYVHGKLKYHVRYNTFSALLSVPSIIFCAIEYGPIGVAWVWFGFRLLSLLLWVPFVHHQFAPGLHKKWLVEDVLYPLVPIVIVVSIGVYVSDTFDDMSRLVHVIILALICISAMTIAGISAFWTTFWTKISERL
jgi:O-antigen/teichoic acid export membrane protein